MSLTSSIKQSGSGMAALYRRYAEWLVSITWKRFIVLSLLLLIVTGMLSSLPPFNWDLATRTTRVPASRSVDITVDDNGVRIKPKRKGSQAPEITIDEHGVRIKREGDSASGKPPQESSSTSMACRCGATRKPRRRPLRARNTRRRAWPGRSHK